MVRNSEIIPVMIRHLSEVFYDIVCQVFDRHASPHQFQLCRIENRVKQQVDLFEELLRRDAIVNIFFNLVDDFQIPVEVDF